MRDHLIGSDAVRDFSEEQDVTQPDDRQPMTEDVMEQYLREGREMVLVREQKSRVEKREKEIKARLMDVLAAYGEPYGDEGQHRYVPFPKAIRGIAGFVRQKKTIHEEDSVEAEVIARQRGIYDRLFKPVMTLDEDAVMVAHREGILTDEDLDRMFPKKVQYAFVAEKAKKR